MTAIEVSTVIRMEAISIFLILITDWLYFFRFIKKMDLNSVLNVTKLLLIEEYFKHT